MVCPTRLPGVRLRLRPYVGQVGNLRPVCNRPVRPFSKSATLRFLLLFALSLFTALAQTASEKPSSDVRRVGMRLACQCGCKDSVATCSMLECGFSKPAKERIARMQAVGMTDDQIVQAFIRDYGPGIYLAPPSAFGWAVPYGVAAFGVVVIWLFVRRYYKPRPASATGSLELDDPALEKYKDRIEKELADLE
jgi:cytochrome c-type biogenesis protein CcmH